METLSTVAITLVICVFIYYVIDTIFRISSANSKYKLTEYSLVTERMNSILDANLSEDNTVKLCEVIIDEKIPDTNIEFEQDLRLEEKVAC